MNMFLMGLFLLFTVGCTTCMCGVKAISDAQNLIA